ncbi:ATP synthase subunit I [Anaerotruncus rubiinfantis]|uniref:ATP synthase subunit I n=1 Tax=Anaerotruncus rubiinfantis TaxID=1720200 RepID=UPI00189A6C5C|nr:ATP synthase subunit I [Anaerotruncus rubiinfantis]
MDSGMVIGLLLGVILAVEDALLVRWIIKKGTERPENASKIVTRGFAARYLLVFAVLAIALLVPGINPLGVVLPLIVQKVVLVIAAAIKK